MRPYERRMKNMDEIDKEFEDIEENKEEEEGKPVLEREEVDEIRTSTAGYVLIDKALKRSKTLQDSEVLDYDYKMCKLRSEQEAAELNADVELKKIEAQIYKTDKEAEAQEKEYELKKKELTIKKVQTGFTGALVIAGIASFIVEAKDRMPVMSDSWKFIRNKIKFF